MSGWSQQLRSNAGALRALAGKLESQPFRPVYAQLEEVWAGPAADLLTAESQQQDVSLDAVGGELRRVAGSLDQQAALIEAQEEAARLEAARAEAEAAAAEALLQEPPAPPPPYFSYM